MRIIMRTKAAGPDGSLLPGISYDLPQERARPLVDGGYAFVVDEQPISDEGDGLTEEQPKEGLEEDPGDGLTEEQREDITSPRGRRKS